jgi:uncharacterized membrane protein YidH (DUF202 family)
MTVGATSERFYRTNVSIRPFAFLGAAVALISGAYSLMGVLMVGSMSGSYSRQAARRDMNIWATLTIISTVVLVICLTTLIRKRR